MIPKKQNAVLMARGLCERTEDNREDKTDENNPYPHHARGLWPGHLETATGKIRKIPNPVEVVPKEYRGRHFRNAPHRATGAVRVRQGMSACNKTFKC
jgi:hypothetical protein